MVEGSASAVRAHFGANKKNTTCNYDKLNETQRRDLVVECSIGQCVCGFVGRIIRSTGLLDKRHRIACNGLHPIGASVPTQRRFQVTAGQLTGTYADEEAQALRAHPPQAQPAHADESEDEDDEIDLDHTGSARAAASSGVVTRGMAAASRRRDAGISAAIIEFASTLQAAHTAKQNLGEGEALPPALRKQALDAWEAIGKAALRPMHANALRQKDAEPRNPEVVLRESALMNVHDTGRIGEFAKRISSAGMANVGNPDVLEGLNSNYNVRFNLEAAADTRDNATASRNARIANTRSDLFAGRNTDDAIISPISEETFSRAYAKLKTDKAAGPDNVKSNDFLNLNTDARLAVLRIINLILARATDGIDGLWKAMSAVNLFAINKGGDDETNVRGIAVGSMIIKTMSLCMLLRHSHAIQLATPSNMGNGCRGGADAFASAMREFVGTAGTATLRGDVVRAFDQVGVEHIMNATRMLKLPDELIEYAYILYNIPCTALVHDRSRQLRLEFEIMEGVRQGDAMSMALYGVGIEPVLMQARADAGNGCVLFNLADDIAANGTPSVIATALYSIAGNITPMTGNTLSATKSEVFVQNEEMEEEMRAALRAQHDAMCARPGGYDGPDMRNIKIQRDGLIAAGVPVGTDDYVHAETRKVAENAINVARKILDCANPELIGKATPLSTQQAVEALRLCILSRLNHILRVQPPHLTHPHAVLLDEAVDTHMRQLHGMTHSLISEEIDADGNVTHQDIHMHELEISWRRVYLGKGVGLGFYKIATTCAAAYLGAVALVAPILHRLFDARSKLTRNDEPRDLSSLRLLPIPHNFAHMLQNLKERLPTVREESTEYEQADEQVQDLFKTFSRDAVVKACRDNKPLMQKQRAISKVVKMMERLLSRAMLYIGYYGSSEQKSFPPPLEEPGNPTRTMHLICDVSDESHARNLSLANLRAFTVSTRDRRNRFSNREWVFAVRLALGIPILSSVQECPCCGAHMSVTATHVLSCQFGRGTRKGAHDFIIEALARTLRECAADAGQAIPVDVTTDRDGDSALVLHNDPAWMHGPRRAAAPGGSFAALAQLDGDGDDEEEKEDDAGDDDTAASARPASKGCERGYYGSATRKQRRNAAQRAAHAAAHPSDIVADLRVRRCIDSPELNPTAARNNVETVDLRVTSPLSASFVAGAAKKQGYAAQLSERTKRAHYLSQYADSANVSPLVIETFGYMSPDAEATLTRLVLLAAGVPKTTDMKALHVLSRSSATAKATYQRVRTFLARVRDSISVALWRSNGYALDHKLRDLNARQQLVFSHPVAWEGPLYPEGCDALWEAGRESEYSKYYLEYT